MHTRHHLQARETGMNSVSGKQSFWYDTDDLATCRKGSIGKGAHHALAATAVHQADVEPGQDASHQAARINKPRFMAGVVAAINTDSFHDKY